MLIIIIIGLIASIVGIIGSTIGLYDYFTFSVTDVDIGFMLCRIAEAEVESGKLIKAIETYNMALKVFMSLHDRKGAKRIRGILTNLTHQLERLAAEEEEKRRLNDDEQG